MKRSVFYDGVEIYSEHLNYVEESKAEAIKNIVLTFGVCGAVKGLVVAPDTDDPYKVMITAGAGYTYGGEYYALSVDVRGVAVSNSIGAKNFVCVKVTEVDEYPLPNVMSGEIKYTRKNHRYDVVVLSESEWVNLADKSMYSLLAIVYGSGGFVRGSDIRRAVVVPSALLFVEQQPVVIRGVKVITVSNNTALGKGVLSYRYDSVSQKGYLKWKAPLLGSFGEEVVIGSDGVYKLWDSLGVTYIQVEVSVADLLSESIDEELNIINMMEQGELRTGTMIDILHRSMMGGGMPSIRNPHGQTLDDLEPGEVQNMQKHQVRFHSAGIVGQKGSNSLKPYLLSSVVLAFQAVAVGEYVISVGRVFDSISPLLVNFSGEPAGEYYVYIDDTGSVSVTTGSVDSEKYCVLCRVFWNGSSLSDLVDLRKFGVLDASKVRHVSDSYEVDVGSPSFSLDDDIGKIRFVLRHIIGESKWDLLPVISLYDIVNVGFTTRRIRVTSPAEADDDVVRVVDLRNQLGSYLTEPKANVLYVRKEGDSMIGDLFLRKHPDEGDDAFIASTKGYVDMQRPLRAYL